MAEKTIANNEDQRAFARVDIVNDAYFMIDDESMENETIKCWCRNLSEGGLALNTEADLSDDINSIKILYRINSKYRNDKLIIKSKNKDQNYNRYGCQFADSDQKRDRLISELINKQA